MSSTMTDAYAAPSGPPPPQVPEGWKAVFDERYNEWFYVNIYTKKSQWDRPTQAAEPDHSHAPPDHPPPSYSERPTDPVTSNTAGTAIAAENPRVNITNEPTTKPIPISTTSNQEPQQQSGSEKPFPPRPAAETDDAQRSGGTGHRLANKLLKKFLGGNQSSQHYQQQYPANGNMYPPGYSHSGFTQGHHSYPPRQGMVFGAPGQYYAPGPGMGGGGGLLGGLGGGRRRGGGMMPGVAMGAGAGLLGGGLLGSAMAGGHHGGYGMGGHGMGGYGMGGHGMGMGMGGHGMGMGMGGHGMGGYGGEGYGEEGYGDGNGSGSGSDGGGGSDAGDFGDGGGDFGGGDFDGGDFGGGDFGGDF